MPIHHNNAPAPNFEVLRANMEGVHPDPNDQSSHIPHPVYYLGNNDLLAGRGLEAAQLVAWRYIFRGDDQQTHVAEIGVDEATDTHVFHLVNRGSHVNDFITLYDRIHEHEAVMNNRYVIALLRAPACYVMAVWFQGLGHEHSFFIPLAPVHSKFVAGMHYEVDEFVHLLEMVASEMVENNS